MKKSSILKISDSRLFRQIKLNLPSRRRFSQIEARIVLKQNRDRLFPLPKTRNFRFFLSLAQEAYTREEYNEAFLLINKTIELLPQSSLSKYNLGNSANPSNLSNPNNINNLKDRKNLGGMKGPNDLDTARIYELAGNIYKRNYRIQGSIDLLERSLGILINTLGEDTIYSQELVFELADSYLSNYNGTEAILYFVEFLRLRNTQFGKFEEFEELDMLVMAKIGLGYYYKSGPKIASRVFREILKLSEQSSRKYNTIQFLILLKLAEINDEARKRDKAKKYYRECFKLIRKRYLDKNISKNTIFEVLIDYYKTIGNYNRSLSLAKKAIKHLMRSKKDNFLEIITKYESISVIYYEKNNRRKYGHYFDKYMILLKKVAGSRHPLFLKSSIEYTDILLGAKGLYKRSLKRLKNTKEELKTVFEQNMYLKANYKLRKGKVYLCLKWTKKSLNKLEEAKGLFLENFGKNHPNYLNCCFFIGNNLHAEGYHDEALAIYKNVFEGFQRVYSSNHIYLCIVSFQIAHIYSKKGNFACSLEYFKKTLALIKTLNLRNSYDTKLVYLGIAQLYLETTKYQMFFYYFKKSSNIESKDNFGRHQYYDFSLLLTSQYFDQTRNLQSCRRIYMKMLKMLINCDRYNKPETIKIITSLARCEIDIGGKTNYKKASKLFFLSKDLYSSLTEKHKIPQKNLLIVDIYTLKAELYILLGKHEDSLSTLRHALNLKRHFYKKNDYQMIDLYHRISIVLLETNRYDECLQMSKKIMKIQLKTSKNLERMSVNYSYIIYSFMKLTRIDEALKYLKQSLKIDKRIFTKNDIRLKNSYFWAGSCYLQQNEADRALKYFIKALSDSKISSNISAADCFIWNTIAIIYSTNGRIYEALNILKFILESANTNKLSKPFVQRFNGNLQIIEKAIEMKSAFDAFHTLKSGLKIITTNLIILE